MASGSFSNSIVNGHYTLRVEWTSTPTTSTNTSSVVVTAKLINDWSLEVGSRTVTNVINGVTQTYSASGISSTGTHTLGSATQSVTHNSDGTKAITITVTYPIQATISGTYYSSITATQSVILDSIPRQSSITSVTPSTVSVNGSNSVTVRITTNSSSYTHKVTWTFGTNTSGERSVAASASPSDTYTIPASWLASIPNASSGTATVTVKTYSGNTQVGSSVSANFTITAGVNPSIGSVSVSAVQPTGVTGISGYVAGFSKAIITASSVSGVQGSSISKVEFLKDGSVISSNTTPSYSYTTPSALTGTSTTFSVKVTDSRGRTSTKSASAITIQAYANPKLSDVNVYRSNSSGTASSTGTYIYIKATATATPASNSITSLSYATKLTSASYYGAETSLTSGTASIPGGFENTSSYNVRIKATDKFSQTSYVYVTVSSQSYTMDFKVGGKAVAFGKVAETDNLLESAWAIKSANDVQGQTLTANGTTANASVMKFLYSDKSNAPAGFVYASYQNYGGRLILREYAGSSITGELTDYFENFRLPAPNADKTGSGSYEIITTKNPSDFPDASNSSGGKVNTGSQEFAGAKTFRSSPRIMVGSQYSTIHFLPTTAVTDSYYALIGLDAGSTTTPTQGRLYFSEASVSSTNGAKTGAYELYWLPVPDQDLAENGNYSVLTSKAPVTVAQGGTGATTAVNARKQLELNTVLLKSAVGTSETTVSTAIGYYSAFIIKGVPGTTSNASVFIPKAAITTSYVQWEISNSGGYIEFEIKYSGANLYVKTHSKTVDVYGLRGA